MQQAHICSDHSPTGVNGLRLNNTVISNEVWLEGIAKWEKNRSSIIYSSTLPECQVIDDSTKVNLDISLTQVNLHFKNGSTIPNRLLEYGLEFSLTEKELYGSVTPLIRSRESTITEEDLYINPGEERLINSLNEPGSLKSKRGNLVQKILYSIGTYDILEFYWDHLILE